MLVNESHCQANVSKPPPEQNGKKNGHHNGDTNGGSNGDEAGVSNGHESGSDTEDAETDTNADTNDNQNGTEPPPPPFPAPGFIPATMQRRADLALSRKPTISYLDVALIQTSKWPPKFRVDVTNLHPSAIFTILGWQTVLDPDALESGIFSIRDAQTNRFLHPHRGFRARQWPPPRTALLQLYPGTTLHVEKTMQTEVINPIPGRTYSVRAKSPWKAVWEAPRAFVSNHMLMALGQDQFWLAGEYESNEVEIEVGEP